MEVEVGSWRPAASRRLQLEGFSDGLLEAKGGIGSACANFL